MDQTNAVYDAQSVFPWYRKSESMTTAEMRRFVHEIRNSKTWAKRYATRRLPIICETEITPLIGEKWQMQGKYSVMVGLKTHRPKICSAKIQITPHGRRISVLLHELAHHIEVDRFNCEPSHSPRFVWFYVALIHDFISKPIAAEFAHVLKCAGAIGNLK